MSEMHEDIETIVLGLTADWHTGMPARVVSYDAGSRKATVQPLLRATKRKARSSGGAIVEAFDRPAVPGVRVLMPRVGSVEVILPLAAGDVVWLLPASRSMAEWGGDGIQSTPQLGRRHSLSDCIALPGLAAASDATLEVEVTSAGKVRVARGVVELLQTLVDVVDAIASSTAIAQTQVLPLPAPPTPGILDPAVKVLLEVAKTKLQAFVA